MRTKNRRGFGTILTLVLVIVFCLGVAGIWHLLFAASTAQLAQRAYLGEQAYELATNAITAAHFLCGEEINEEGSQLYDLIRNEKDAFSLELAPSRLTAIENELAQKRNFRLDKVQVDVLFQRPSSLMCPTAYDRYGSFNISTEVTHLPTGVTRKLSKNYEFKFNLTAVPRPFDVSTIFVTNVAPFVHANSIDGNANNNIKEAWDRIGYIVFLSNYYVCQINFAATALAQADSEYSQGANHLMMATNEILFVSSHFNTLEAMEPGTTGPAWFPDGAFALSSTTAEIDLAQFDLPQKIGEHIEKLKTLEVEWNNAAVALNTYLGTSVTPPDLSPVITFAKKYTQSSKDIIDEYHAMLATYREFQKNFNIIGGDTYNDLQPFIKSLSCRDLCARATNIICEGDTFQSGDSRSISEKVKDLLTECETFSGCLYVQNPKETLTLDLEGFQGHLVIVSEGPLTITRARLADKTRDTLTIIALSKVTIDGPIEGGLVARNEIISMSDLAISGPLFVQCLCSKWMEGKVTRSPNLIAGPNVTDGTSNTVDINYQYAAIAPLARTVNLERR